MHSWLLGRCVLVYLLTVTLVVSNGLCAYAAGQRVRPTKPPQTAPQYYDSRGEISVEGLRWELTDDGIAVTAPLRNVQFIQVRFQPVIRVLDASGNILAEKRLDAVSLPPHEIYTIRRRIPLSKDHASRMNSVRIGFLDRE